MILHTRTSEAEILYSLNRVLFRRPCSFSRPRNVVRMLHECDIVIVSRFVQLDVHVSLPRYGRFKLS